MKTLAKTLLLSSFTLAACLLMLPPAHFARPAQEVEVAATIAFAEGPPLS